MTEYFYKLNPFTFPLMILISISTCMCVFYTSDKFEYIYYEKIKKVICPVVLSALVGGKLIFASVMLLKGETSLFVIFSGFVFYGGFIGSLIGLLIYCIKHKEDYFLLSDIILCLLPLGQSIGRIGCFFNGCCYGREYDGILSVKYIINGVEKRIVPTWFIESFFCFALFLFLFRCIPFRIKGLTTSLYMMFYSLFRFIIEFFRGDDIRGIYFGISVSQYISILLFIFGIIIFNIKIKCKKGI